MCEIMFSQSFVISNTYVCQMRAVQSFTTWLLWASKFAITTLAGRISNVFVKTAYRKHDYTQLRLKRQPDVDIIKQKQKYEI